MYRSKDVGQPGWVIFPWVIQLSGSRLVILSNIAVIHTMGERSIRECQLVLLSY